MKYLGIDFGIKRVGLALSDEAGEFAFPKGIFDRALAVQKIAALCEAEQVSSIIVGYPVASNEAANELVQVIETFSTKLKEQTQLPVFFEREDFSSVEAHRYQIHAGNRDDSAAAIILQRFLDRKKV